MYKLEQGLVDLINAQRAEAEEFSKKPGCWMGKMVEASDLEYWESRVPSGTLKEYNRIELEESVYYAVADAYSKSMARSMNLSVWTDEELEAELDAACKMIESQAQEEQMREEAEQNHFDSLANDLNVDRGTLNRWMENA
jgi:hypothetical protein